MLHNLVAFLAVSPLRPLGPGDNSKTTDKYEASGCRHVAKLREEDRLGLQMDVLAAQLDAVGHRPVMVVMWGKHAEQRI